LIIVAEEFSILGSAGGIRFALIPYHSLDREGGQRGDVGIVKERAEIVGIQDEGLRAVLQGLGGEQGEGRLRFHQPGVIDIRRVGDG
jgi:hypothetical protein